MGFLWLVECQNDSKRKAFRIQKIVRSPLRSWYDETKCRGAGVCLKNFYARYGESASSQTKVRIRQTKYAESANEGTSASIFKAYILTDKRWHSVGERKLFENGKCSGREEKAATFSVN